MKGGIVTLLHNLLLEQDKYYSKPIKGLTMDKHFGDGGDQEEHVLIFCM